MLVQSALLGAGSLDQPIVQALRARPAVARRYLALEGHRVLADLAERLQLVDTLRPDGAPSTVTSAESLEMARARGSVPDPPKWFGIIKPSRLLAPTLGPGTQASSTDLHLASAPLGPSQDDDADDEQSDESKILKLFESTDFHLTGCLGVLSEAVRQLALPRGQHRRRGTAGRLRSARSAVGAHARPLPTRIHFTEDGKPGAAVGIGGARYPEWDVHNNRYRPSGAGPSTSR